MSTDSIKKVVKMLDCYKELYKTLSGNRADNYLEYCRLNIRDEELLIKPKLFPEFLNKLLDFSKFDIISNLRDRVGKIPDLTPENLKMHPYLFELKGMDSSIEDLKREYETKTRLYIKDNPEVKYAIITNLRDLLVFTEEGLQERYSFSFEQLYKDWVRYKGSRVLSLKNTKKFLKFIEDFKKKQLTKEEKINYIANAQPWTSRILDLKNNHFEYIRITAELRKIINIFREDIDRKEINKLLLYCDGERKIKIAKEIYAIARDLESKFESPREVTSEDLKQIMGAESGTTLNKALEAYYYRVAYFTMTRLLLIRSWEDAEFIQKNQWILFNGGFKAYYYSRWCNQNIKDVLRRAYQLGAERYQWLFTNKNNYSWYMPSEDALVDVLYILSKFNLSYLNRDILGEVYEEYLEIAAKKKTGQYYTPIQIVELILNRVGFIGDNIFNFESGKRRPKLVLDIATGSGGFPVEGARRILESIDLERASLEDVKEIKYCIVKGFYGSEISAFAYYLTEVNMLLQLTPLIKQLLHKAPELIEIEGRFTLGFLHQNSLKLFTRKQTTINNNSKDEFLEEDQEHDIVELEGAKKDVYNFIKNSKFDYAVSNPPYIGEKGNKELFRKTLELYPYWKKFYQGKMDYFYWFIELALSKLKEGGKLGFITTAYWPTADGASKLRQFILDNAIIKEIIYFGEIKLFEHALGQHNMIFILEKCSDPFLKKENKIKIVKLKKPFEGKNIKQKLDNLKENIESRIDKEEYRDEYLEVFWSAVKQGELSEKAWNIMHSECIEKILNKIRTKTEPLGNICQINQGIVSGADKVTVKNIKYIPSDIIQEYNIKVGDGIFVISQDELNSLNLNRKEKKLIKPFYKNSDIDPYYVYINYPDSKYIIYVNNQIKIDEYPNIKAHLEKFKSVLIERLDKYNEEYNWFELHRPRDQKIFESEKIVTSKRQSRNTFALENQKRYEQSDITIITKKENIDENLKYILALLNSKVLDFYYRFKGKTKGNMREYYYTPLSSVPILRIDFESGE
ncbi:MAG: Eco57I restriction-modification methylase domain-containing protein, partial [Methanosarcinales archaeon]